MGSCVIPSQLRDRLPGLKNAFLQDTYCIDSHSQKTEHILRQHHCGTIAYVSDDKEELASMVLPDADDWKWSEEMINEAKDKVQAWKGIL